ncbi:ATP-binding protein [Cognataquiflexum aquatile]|uniref:ATP-binding protein n=1 Tax=Cognataquiflexum aquatile TaxID=2249427 RepID=UPI000DE85734|nr:ATP-binding protein [Cognataquiflexum aquatile]
MKHTLTFIILIFLVSFGKAQQSTTIGQLTQADLDLFQKIEKETNPDRIIELAFNLVFLSDDKAPLPLLEEAKMLYDLSQKKRSTFLECVAMSLYAQGYRITGDFTKSQEYHYKAIDIAKKIGDYSLLGYSLNQSAHMYKDREENDRAIAIYKEASETANKGSEPVFKFYPIMNLGFVYMQENKADSAMFYSTKAVSMIKDLLLNMEDANQKIIVERSLLVYCLSNLAGSYSILNDKINADKYYGEALEIIEKYKGLKSRYFQFVYYSLANHYYRYKDEDSAIIAAKLAIESVSNSPLEYLSARPAKMISDYYESKNADSTVKYLKIYLKGNEVMNSTRVTQQLQMKSVEEEQKALEFQRAEEAYRNKIAFYILGVGLVVLLFVALIIYRSSQQRKRINAQLQIQKEQVEKTLIELKSTQSQLIQSEKMASLGELTAGIAHEIQNPLNFVNNFSEVSAELMEELKGERLKVKSERNESVEDEIIGDVIQNLEKINHHGKRADAIVKGMLEHSRTGSGVKELTDLNALADEFFRLSYQSFLAKDPDFKVELQTNLDLGLPKISVIPQDIGKILLNLYSNAFYACAERSRSTVNERSKTDPEFKPLVQLTTRNLGGKIEVGVKDNGPGIPDAIKSKIFQPFFTTKPTGQGTGLGLSLSYDIVKAHGGELRVETKEGEGSEFIIQLPKQVLI